MKRVVMSVLLLCTFACASTPVYCQPDVIKAMKFIWMESHNGTSGIEATFILNGAPEAYTIEQEPMTQEYGKQHILLHPGQTFGLIHVHPNSSGMYPSTPSNTQAGNGMGDTGMADKRAIDIYVVHRLGLSVYRWQTKETVLLRQGMSWTDTKGCE